MDTVAITAGSGTNIGVDTVGTTKVQVVKLSFGSDGVATFVDASNGLPVNIVAGTVSLPGEDHIGEVGGNTAVISPTVTISVSAYAAGDVIGGKLTLTNAMRKSGGTGLLHSLAIFDADNEKAAFDVLLFDSDLSSTTTDNLAVTWNSADYSKFLGRVNVAATDYLTVNSRAMAVKTGINLPVAANGSAHLYAVVIATATPSYSTTSDLKLRFGFLRD